MKVVETPNLLEKLVFVENKVKGLRNPEPIFWNTPLVLKILGSSAFSVFILAGLITKYYESAVLLFMFLIVNLSRKGVIQIPLIDILGNLRKMEY